MRTPRPHMRNSGRLIKLIYDGVEDETAWTAALASRKVGLCGHRSTSAILLKMLASPASIGGTISGHMDETPAATLAPGL